MSELSKLVIAGRPTNLRQVGKRNRVVTADLYDVCERVKELDPNLYIVEQENLDGGSHQYVIMEHVPKLNRDEIVFKTPYLDQRILDKLDEIRALPFAERADAAIREAEKYAKDAKEHASEELYERMGAPMYNQLHRDGFASGGRNKSFPIVRPKKWRQ